MKGSAGSGFGNSRDIICPFHGFRWNLEGGFEGAPCAGFRPNVTYRFMPYNDSLEMCTMEIMLLRYPKSQARPRDASVQFVPADQTLDNYIKTDIGEGS